MLRTMLELDFRLLFGGTIDGRVNKYHVVYYLFVLLLYLLKIDDEAVWWVTSF